MPKHNCNLQKAIDSLVINDVYLKTAQSSCVGDFEPKYFSALDTLQIQQMHSVQESIVVTLDDNITLLRVLIRVGVRWIGPENTEDNPDIKAFIEADFIAEYVMKSELEQACIDEFSLKNASYHVWPYWREYLGSQCERLRLPRLMLPMVQFGKQE